MGTIIKRRAKDGKVSWTVRIRKRGYPEKVATFDRLADAKHYESQEEQKIRQGLYLENHEAKQHLLKGAIKRYKDEELPNKNPGSISKEKIHLSWWEDNYGDYQLSAVSSPVLLNEAKGKLKCRTTVVGVGKERKLKRFSGSTVNYYLITLSCVFTACQDWGWSQRNPIRDIKKEKLPKGRLRFLSDEERKKLLDACKKSKYPHLYFITILALSTGMRKSELLGLKWKDVELEKGFLLLHETKNKEPRRVALRGHALELFKAHSKVRHLKTGLVFPSSKRGRKDKPFDITNSWQAALKKSEVKDFVFHDLRHSCASYLAMNGATLPEIAEVLGHKTFQMVKRYTHLSESHVEGVVEKMNQKLFG